MRRDALVRPVFARDIAKLAADAEVRVDLGDDFVIQVKVAPIQNVGQRAPAKILNRAETVVVHVLR